MLGTFPEISQLLVLTNLLLVIVINQNDEISCKTPSVKKGVAK